MDDGVSYGFLFQIKAKLIYQITFCLALFFCRV